MCGWVLSVESGIRSLAPPENSHSRACAAAKDTAYRVYFCGKLETLQRCAERQLSSRFHHQTNVAPSPKRRSSLASTENNSESKNKLANMVRDCNASFCFCNGFNVIGSGGVFVDVSACRWPDDVFLLFCFFCVCVSTAAKSTTEVEGTENGRRHGRW